MSWATRFELRQHLKGSLWVLPLLGGVLGVFLAQVALLVDGAVRLPAGWNYSGSTASGVLTAIVGAMVALIGFVVTIGVLVVQQATGTLSPRSMRLWYRDRLQKVVLATFVGTFTFAFSLLLGSRTISCRTSASPWPGSLSRPVGFQNAAPAADQR